MSDSITKFSYPHEKLTPIIGKPTNVTLLTFKQEIYANAMATVCKLGGGRLGYLGAIMPAMEYTTFSNGIPFNKPANPTEIIDDPNKGFDEKHLEKEEYKSALTAFTKCCLIEADIKHQMLDAIEHEYLEPLRNPYLGFGQTTPTDILTLLTEKYDLITTEDLSKNLEMLSAKWNADESIILLFKRIKECKRIAALGGQPLTDNFLINKTLKVLEDTGVYIQWTTQWRQMYPRETTWTMGLFEENCENAETERSRLLTAKTAGYHGANSATTKLPSTTSTPTTITGHMSKYVFMGPNGKYISYCWTHGCCANWKHTSATCRNKKEGHQDAATFFDMMGGCQLINTSPRNTNKNEATPANVTNSA
jgi:hypothetical protein